MYLYNADQIVRPVQMWGALKHVQSRLIGLGIEAPALCPINGANAIKKNLYIRELYFIANGGRTMLFFSFAVCRNVVMTDGFFLRITVGRTIAKLNGGDGTR